MDYIWSTLGYIVPFLFVLGIVVVVHELGHFLVARWCGVEVQVFSVGFGPEIAGFNDRRGTRWRLAAVPLGGYVKFLGDANAASAPDQGAVSALSPAQRSRSFADKSVAQRAAVVAAGPIANFLLAILIFSGTVYWFGRQVVIPRVEVVQPASAAEAAGLRAGDIVLSVDGRAIASFNELQRIVSTSADNPLALEVDRGGERLSLQATPRLREEKTPFGVQRIGLLGLQGSRNPADVKAERYGLARSVSIGMGETWYIVEQTGRYVSRLVTGRESADQLSGPIRIAQVSGVVATAGIAALINLAAILSVSIGLINLVPVPMLDGGHLMFYAIEALRGRPLSDRAQEYGFRVGFALVIMLMLFSTWNDIRSLTSL